MFILKARTHKADLGLIIDRYRPDLRPFEDLYRSIHQNPELSFKESKTTSKVSRQLGTSGFTVERNIGGHGVVGVLKNGQGPTVMLRSELDALPIEEMTSLPYASRVTMEDHYGVMRPVMHACGHDLHIASLLAALELLGAAKLHWNGTLLAVFQPNEEHTGGAQAMVDDGLYSKVPIPGVVLAQHSNAIKEGMLNIRSGPVLVAADTVKIRIFGTVHDTANPQNNLDVIEITSTVMERLRKIMTHEATSTSFFSVKYEEIRAGQPGLDVVEYSDIVLDVKTYDSEVRNRIHADISDIVQSACEDAGVQKPPLIQFRVRAPLTSNSIGVVEPLRETFGAYFKDNVGEGEPRRPCEDFSVLATSVGKPYAMWFIGTVDADKWEKAKKDGEIAKSIPSNHSPFFAPAVTPSLRLGTDAMALAALTFLDVGRSSAHV